MVVILVIPHEEARLRSAHIVLQIDCVTRNSSVRALIVFSFYTRNENYHFNWAVHFPILQIVIVLCSVMGDLNLMLIYSTIPQSTRS